MTKVMEFGERMCRECGIPYKPCMGMTDDILAIGIDDNDVIGKAELKNWLNQHHWVFVKNDDKYIDMCNGAFQVHHKEVTYKHGNHKIVIM